MTTSTETRKRGSNFTAADRSLVVDLALKWASIVENKRTDFVTTRQKEEAWQSIASEFNGCASTPRDASTLKQVWAYSLFCLKTVLRHIEPMLTH